MMRKILTLTAVMTSLMLASQSAAEAATITTTLLTPDNPINIDGTEFNMFFNQGTDSLTTFNDVFGT